MSEHRATLRWSRDGAGFGYRDYPRDHRWAFDNGQELRASAAPEFLGSEESTDPEEAYTAALASCHLLTFLAIASMSGFVVDSYEDAPVGYLEKAEDGKPWMARVVMRPRIVFSGEKIPDPDQIERMHHKAHRECFLARSVRTEVTWESA